ncbi:phosphomethylpyrimidine synthase ThiC [Nocardia sp. CNY236]|uniref:phosphomethylpyrimidine synthase ThiC n=1 Tax=Nocardia sp. CNY236 TaxID=1169152 RepID=UPI00056AA820|nr:phosphomethylpyrimidine synthase ThiC [Nocardia sp. CNY236]
MPAPPTNSTRADRSPALSTKRPLGACVTYDLFTDPRKKLSRSEFLERFEQGLTGGVDFVLAHFGTSPALAEMMGRSHRIMPTTSRGGGLIDRYMRIHRCDNPLLEHLDGIIDICRRMEVVVDLGDIFRPGATADAGDEMKWAEIQLLARGPHADPERRRAGAV